MHKVTTPGLIKREAYVFYQFILLQTLLEYLYKVALGILVKKLTFATILCIFHWQNYLGIL